MKNILIGLCGFLYAAHAMAICKINTANELINLIRNNHPQIKQNNEKIKYSKYEEEIAATISNPRLDIEKSFNDTKSTEIAITQKIELGGKRTNRKDLAKKHNNLSKFILDIEGQKILIDSILELHEIQRISLSLPLYTESLEAFSKIHRALNTYKTLSPEKQVEKDTLDLVISDYKFKIAQLQLLQEEKKNHVRISTASNCSILESSYRVEFDSWPKITEAKTPIENLKLRAAKAQVDVNELAYELEKSNSYPDLEIGPKVAIDDNQKSYSLNISFDLPLFDRNSPAKSYQLAKLNAAKKVKLNIEEQTRLNYQSWISKYKRLKKTLDLIDDHKNFEQKHKRMEKLFKRGIISTNLVIETHRQLIEFSDTRHDLEHELLEAYLKVAEFNGELNSIKF